MTRQPFSLAHLREAADAIYERPEWQVQLAKALDTNPAMIRKWLDGAPLPDLRKRLADLCRERRPYDPDMERMARRLTSLGPPE
jgi:hypothetical protein